MASQYGCEYPCVTGTAFSNGIVTGKLFSRAPGFTASGSFQTPATAPLSNETCALERLITVVVTDNFAPGLTSGWRASASTYSPAHNAMVSSNSASFTLAIGSAIAATSGRAFASALSDFSGCAISKERSASSISGATAAPPGTRFQLVSMPSKRSFDTLSPATRPNVVSPPPGRRTAPVPWL